MIELTPADIIRLRALGVRAEPDCTVRLTRDDEIIIALNDSLAEAVRRERRAWAEARRWRLWGYVCLLCTTASIAAQIIGAVARRGGW
ncbi:MAG: hypothetical protein KatS3mg004_1877 [Bryobacteraceae bacterium]|nr:MAG: hypothetical protein KatS3mg004_1877 [Bryobacteraceae bacterium]